MITTKLKDGRLKHTIEGYPHWVGYQNPNEPMIKTKWINLNMPVSEEWEFEASDRSRKAGFTKWIVTLVNGKLMCDCGGFRFQRQCKHTKQVEALIG
jgi:hypothetical protein